MNKAISIDPGISKCGLIVADINSKKVCEAEVIKSENLINYIKMIYQDEQQLQLIIGNGTSSSYFINKLNKFIPNLIIAEEKNSTYRAKQRFYEIFPLEGLKYFLPREIFILNKNLDALAALVILEDYYDCKFEMDKKISIKTWLK